MTKILITTATDLSREEPIVFSTFPKEYRNRQVQFRRKGYNVRSFAPQTYSETIRASAAIPIIFSPVCLDIDHNTRLFVDGGVTNNTPIGLAIDAGAEDITVIYVEGPHTAPPFKTSVLSLPAIAVGCFTIMQQRLLMLDYEVALRTNDAERADARHTAGKRQVRLRKFFPQTPLEVGIVNFADQSAIDAAFAQGQRDASNPYLRGGYAR